MCTGEMKYVILRIDTHVLRIDLCPRKRTRIRRQKQDEDVHLFLSERKKARPLPGQGSWPNTRRDPNARTTVTVGAYCIRPPNGPQGPNGTYPERPVGPPDHSPGRTGIRTNKPTGLRARMDERRVRVFATDGGARWGVFCCAPTRVPPTNQHLNGPLGPNNINRAARPPTLSELWTQKRITSTCSSSCCSS